MIEDEIEMIVFCSLASNTRFALLTLTRLQLNTALMLQTANGTLLQLFVAAAR